VGLGVEKSGIGSGKEWDWQWKIVGLGVVDNGNGIEWDRVGLGVG
jgi:hypothetical protein